MGCFPSKRPKGHRIGETEVNGNQHNHQKPSKHELKNQMKMKANHESLLMTATDDGTLHTNDTVPQMQVSATTASSLTTTTIPSDVSTLSNTSAKSETDVKAFKDSLLNNNRTGNEMNADLNGVLNGGAHQSLTYPNVSSLDCESKETIEIVAKMRIKYKQKKHSPSVRVLCNELNDCLKTTANVFKVVSFAKQESIAVKRLDLIHNGLNVYKDITSVHFNDVKEVLIHSGSYCKEIRIELKCNARLEISEDLVKPNLSFSAYPRVLSFVVLTKTEATNAFNTAVSGNALRKEFKGFHQSICAANEGEKYFKIISKLYSPKISDILFVN